MKSFNKLSRKSLQDDLIVKTEYESLCNIFIKYVEETKIESYFFRDEHKDKIKQF